MLCNDNDVIAMITFRISMFLFSGISIMISANKFYGTKPKARYTTLLEACDYTSWHRSRSIVLLQPESGNIYHESDTENVPEHFANDDALFKPAGELGVDTSSCTSHNDSESEIEVPTPKRQKTCSQL